MKATRKIEIFILVLFVFTISAFSQNIVINETQSANLNTIADEDGEYSDWIELYNNGNSVINLYDWGISDKISEPFKWRFPRVLLGPGEYLLLFASGKDRIDWINHWETNIDQGDPWKYLADNTDPGAAWHTAIYDDTNWSNGPSGIGYGDGDDLTVIGKTAALFMRKKFTIADLSKIQNLRFFMDYDDAFVAYMNGTEIARSENIGTVGVMPAYNQYADYTHEAQIYQGGIPDMYEIINFGGLLQNGENLLAVQVHDRTATSSDLSAIPFLVTGMSEVPAIARGLNPILNFSKINLHTNFRIDNEGETLILTNPAGQLVHSVDLPAMQRDYSFGNYPDGSGENFYFSGPTPGQSNAGGAHFRGYASLPEFNLPGGFYEDSVQVELRNPSRLEKVYYTLDGSEPDQTSDLFTGKLVLTATSVLRARKYTDGYFPSKTLTQTYLVDEHTTLPVLSLATAPDNLWDDQRGIYVEGTNGITGYCSSTPRNWNQDWERPVSLEFYDENRQPGFQIDAGVKIGGGCTRLYAEKTLALYFRSEYGYSKLNYPVFPEKQITEYNNLNLRNAGQDWYRAMLRDGLLQMIIKDRMDIDWQAFRPAILFLNGEYWGIHNIREKHNEHYLAANHGIDPDAIDILSGNMNIKQGSAADYQALINFIETHDISQAANYEYVRSQMDINEYLNYQIAEIYFANIDWPGGNIKYWKPQTPGSKWRWIIFDLDLGFGAHPYGQYSSNTLATVTSPNQTYYANPSWSTFLFRKLLENENFRNDFIQRYCAHISTTFDVNRVLPMLDSLTALISDEVPRHLNKWPASLSLGNNWQEHLQIMRDFATYRPLMARNHIRDKFNLSGTARMYFRVQPAEAGEILLNTVSVTSQSGDAVVMRTVPIDLTVKPASGWRFIEWQGAVQSVQPSVSFVPAATDTILAVFTPINSQSSNIVINEINYNSAPDFDTEDWLELYNNSGTNLDISSWVLSDANEDNRFVLPTRTTVFADSFLVLCRDTTAFRSLFPGVDNIAGNFDFGLSNGGETVRLFDASQNLIDSLTYQDEWPWPQSPDGDGPTLALKNPDLDNSKAANWAASSGHGTPGTKNRDVLTGVSSNTEPEIPQKMVLRPVYPNPFNPQTKITFELSEQAVVDLSIFDIEGRLVQKILHGKISAGEHSVEWNAGHSFSSGVYLVRLSTEKFTQTRKMILLK